MEQTLKIPTMLTIAECAKRTHFAESRIRELCKLGKIVFVPCGNKKVLINLEKFIEFMNTNTEYFEMEENIPENKYGIKPIQI